MLKNFKDIAYVVIGNAILAFSVVAFVIPNNTLSGGLAGIAILVKPFIDIPTDVIITFLTITLFLIGAIALGKEFAYKTLLSSIVYPITISVFSRFVSPIYCEPILSALYAGVIGGFGIGLAISTGASTGGMDIPPLILNKYFHLDISKGILIVDALTILFGIYIYGIQAVLIGLICVYITSVFIGRTLMLGHLNAKRVEIISELHDQIADEILNKLDRGLTYYDAEGGYSRKKSKVIVTVVPEKEFVLVEEIVKKIDPEAFVIVSDVAEVKGEGFTFAPKI